MKHTYDPQTTDNVYINIYILYDIQTDENVQ